MLFIVNHIKYLRFLQRSNNKYGEILLLLVIHPQCLSLWYHSRLVWSSRYKFECWILCVTQWEPYHSNSHLKKNIPTGWGHVGSMYRKAPYKFCTKDAGCFGSNGVHTRNINHFSFMSVDIQPAKIAASIPFQVGKKFIHPQKATRHSMWIYGVSLHWHIHYGKCVIRRMTNDWFVFSQVNECIYERQQTKITHIHILCNLIGYLFDKLKPINSIPDATVFSLPLWICGECGFVSLMFLLPFHQIKPICHLCHTEANESQRAHNHSSNCLQWYDTIAITINTKN